MEHCFADVNGVRLHYVKAGAGPLMIFLHGFPEFWYEWRKQLPAFAKDHLVIAPDMRGYNLSSKPAEVEPYAVGHLVEDVRALAEHLGYRKFILVGHDWGGAVAWAFAIRCAESLDKLVIINAPHPGVFGRLLSENAEQQGASKYMLAFQNPGVENWLAANDFANLRGAMYGTGLREGVFSEADWAEYAKAWSQPGALTGALRYYRALRLTKAAGDLTVRVPTLVLWGEKDPALVLANVEGLGEFVPRLTVKRFAEASHWLVHDYTEEVNAAIREFL